MRIKVEKHPELKQLSKAKTQKLYEKAKKNLRVGFEIEMYGNEYCTEDGIDSSYAEETLDRIAEEFEKSFGFQMAVGKDTNHKKIIKKSFSDGKINFEIPVEIDVDGYKEHFLVPCGYVDGSTPIELVTSPIIPSVDIIKEVFDKIYDTVKSVDDSLVANCHERCGLHQTVVFDHLEETFPEIVIANAIQITRAFIPGIFYLLSSGTLAQASRCLDHRHHNASLWRRNLNTIAKYSMVFPRIRVRNQPSEVEYWGIEFRYPDGTQSSVLPGIMAVINTAIVLKSIRLSQYGVLKISEEYYAKAKESINQFVSYRGFSTEEIENKDFLPRVVADEFVRFISEDLIETDNKSLAIIKSLNPRPFWMRFKSYDEMNASRYKEIDNYLLSADKSDTLKEQIEEALLTDSSNAKDRRNAIRRISTRIGRTYSETSRILKKYGYHWSPKLSKLILLQ